MERETHDSDGTNTGTKAESKEDSERVEELHGLDELGLRVKVRDDDGLDVGSEGEICKDAGTTEEDCKTNLETWNLATESSKKDIPMRKDMTPVRTAGNLRGSLIESEIGMTYPRT